MELKDLEQHERVVLAVLLRLAVMSDGTVSDDEAVDIDIIAEAWGIEAYRQLLAESQETVRDMQQLKEKAARVERPEARELIFGTIYEVAATDAITNLEGELLDALSEMWGIQPKFEGFPEDGETP